jgi:hypothetical protein
MGAADIHSRDKQAGAKTCKPFNTKTSSSTKGAQKNFVLCVSFCAFVLKFGVS